MQIIIMKDQINVTTPEDSTLVFKDDEIYIFLLIEETIDDSRRCRIVRRERGVRGLIRNKVIIDAPYKDTTIINLREQ